MIGDRLDNDIISSIQVGMKKIWGKQGLAKYQNNINMEENIDYVVDNLIDLKKYL